MLDRSADIVDSQYLDGQGAEASGLSDSGLANSNTASPAIPANYIDAHLLAQTKASHKARIMQSLQVTGALSIYTLANSVSVDGKGLHSGAMAKVQLTPSHAPGIRLTRSDLPKGQGEFTLDAAHVQGTELCTQLKNEHGHALSTVEHLLAALAGLNIYALDILVDGPELPILDGSSQPWIDAIDKGGLAQLLGQKMPVLIIEDEVIVEDEKGGWAKFTPLSQQDMARHGAGLVIDLTIDYQGSLIGQQKSRFFLNGQGFRQLANARTFCLLRDVEYMQARGLIKGGDLSNAVVVDGNQVKNPEGLRHDQEFVRHKILDCVGDLALAGHVIVGRFEGYRSGHGLNNRLLRALLSDSDHYSRA